MPTMAKAIADEFAAAGADEARARTDLTGVIHGPLTQPQARRYRRGLQAWLVKKRMAQDGYSVERRLRARLARWRLRTLPGRVGRIVVDNLHKLKRHAPPRVRASVFGLLFHRWTTDRRMRQLRATQRGWLLGCGAGADAVEHYLKCPVVTEWIRSRMRDVQAPYSFDRWFMAERRPDTDTCRTANAIYVVYRVTQHLRHSSHAIAGHEYVRHYMNQCLHEATRDSPGLRRVCDGLHPGPVRKRRRVDGATTR